MHDVTHEPSNDGRAWEQRLLLLPRWLAAVPLLDVLCCGVPSTQELLPVIDAFEAAAGQVKADTEGEQRIAGSYQVRRNCLQC